MTNFETAMQFVALHEWSNRADGGYTNDPVDPGGETKYGISKAAHPTVDIASLTLPDAFAIYRQQYWDANNLDSRPFPYSVALMDSFVQHSPRRVNQWDQQANGDYNALIRLRRSYYLYLISVNPEDIRFRNGWLRRLNDLGKYCDILNVPA